MVNKSKFTNFSLLALVNLLFGFLSLVWLLEKEFHVWSQEIYTFIYFVLPLVGAVIGWRVRSVWGGWQSLLGKSITLFSLGLFAQVFGQLVYNWYVLTQPEIGIPYPSAGDIGYFGSIPLYILGTIYLSEISGSRFSMKSMGSKILIIFLPFCALLFSYLFFINGHALDTSNLIRLFLDFGYPFGQAIYISLALLTLLLSHNYLGGKLRMSIMLILIALITQYVADFMFLYQTSRNAWELGGINDFIYLISYYLMSLSLVSFSQVYARITNPSAR